LRSSAGNGNFEREAIVNRQAGWGIAAIGTALALIAIWLDTLNDGTTYWSDGTTGVFLLVVCAIAGLALLAAFRGEDTTGWAFGAGAVLFGFYGWLPTVLAFDQWDQLDAGAWLGVAGGGLLMIGALILFTAAGKLPATTPAGMTPPALAAAAGVALIIVSIFVDTLSGTSYWNLSGHSLGIVLLILAAAAGLVWAAGMMGNATHGLDQALTLVLLGLMAVAPVGAAFGDFGSLDAGAWLGLAGGLLAAGGTWAARGGELPHAAAMPA
jgi:hypothetical protein